MTHKFRPVLEEDHVSDLHGDQRNSAEGQQCHMAEERWRKPEVYTCLGTCKIKNYSHQVYCEETA